MPVLLWTFAPIVIVILLVLLLCSIKIIVDVYVFVIKMVDKLNKGDIEND